MPRDVLQDTFEEEASFTDPNKSAAVDQDHTSSPVDSDKVSPLSEVLMISSFVDKGTHVTERSFCTTGMGKSTSPRYLCGLRHMWHCADVYVMYDAFVFVRIWVLLYVKCIIMCVYTWHCEIGFISGFSRFVKACYLV